jgi:NACalpha-BTF3-like transcription factor
MCQALQELLKDEIDEKINSATTTTRIDDIKNLMESFKISAEEAMDALKISVNERAYYINKL